MGIGASIPGDPDLTREQEQESFKQMDREKLQDQWWEHFIDSLASDCNCDLEAKVKRDLLNLHHNSKGDMLTRSRTDCKSETQTKN